MSMFAMPFLVINYGAEMFFILDQRLQAQSVTPERSSKVLLDVVKAMFEPTFIDELLRPQPVYTSAAIKEIFDRLAHSSIMRLSANSMDKLYDLMTMGCKYQYVTLRHPQELIELTLNHLDNIALALSAESESLTEMVRKLSALLRTLTCGTLADTRHELLNFFQGKRVKVSLFLQEGMQNADATLNIPNDKVLHPLPTSEAPGTIRYFDQGQVVLTETFAHPASNLPAAAAAGSYDPMNAASRQCTQGKNLYLIERKKKTTDGKTEPAAKSATTSAAVPAGATAPPPTPATATLAAKVQAKQPKPSASSTTGSSAACGALNSLATLLGGSAAQPSANNFRLNLFDDPHDDEAPEAGTAGLAVRAAPVEILQISKVSREEAMKTNSELVRVMNEFGSAAAAAPAAASGGDDLLDLMDSA